MKKYTILLVDDEENVIQVIMKKINWADIGFDVIGYANNGIKAFDMVEEFRPDVVMTDIKMPYMDGISLAKRMKEEYPATKILIFTGFDEFEYAKEAIRLEVEDYILKPVNSKELTSVLIKIKEKMDQEIEEKRSVEVLEKYYMDSLPLLQVNFYSSLIEGKVKEKEIPKYLSDYRISLTGPYYCSLIIYTSMNSVPESMNPLLLVASVQKQAIEYFQNKWNIKYFSYDGNTVLIVQFEKESEISELTDECDRFCKYEQQIIGAAVTIGIGQVCNKYSDISKSYRSARDAVSYRVIYGSCKAINIKEIEPQENNEIESKSESKLTRLFKEIRLGSQEQIVDVIDQYIKNIFLPAQSLQQYNIEIMGLVGAFYRFSVNNDIVIDETFGDIRNAYNKIIDLDANELRKWMTDISFSFRDKLIDARSTSTKSFVSKAKTYIYNNYRDENMSLNSVCEVLGVSNSYFSSVFKKETGKSFIAYLTEYRMEKAAALLLETNEKSYIIAKQVGYMDANYFSYVFKRQFGVSPSKYRTEHIESEQ